MTAAAGHPLGCGSGGTAWRLRLWLAASARCLALLAAQVGPLPLAAAVTVGALAGLGAFTFGYGKGAAYLSNNPAACANCHVMQGHYASWVKSSHHGVATCNDCHLSPHPIGKWVVKGDNGFFHSLAFTTGRFVEPIRIKERNRRVTQRTCLKCHQDLVALLRLGTVTEDYPWCAKCHQEVGHARR